MSIRLDHGDDSLAVIHDINVTPFIDVILVLLIIFMITAPIMQGGVDVRLHLDHAAPRSRPSLRNMSRMPRAAWRRRCSFSISAMRT